jgi:hypothetical protein
MNLVPPISVKGFEHLIIDDIAKSHPNDWIPAVAGMTAVLTDQY